MHLVVLAARRALFSAGSKMAMSRAMMPMTTRSSTRVKPTVRRPRGGLGRFGIAISSDLGTAHVLYNLSHRVGEEFFTQFFSGCPRGAKKKPAREGAGFDSEQFITA